MMYLAYGSNLHPLRLKERVPSAEVVAVVQLTGHRLAFSKRGADGSGKCTLLPGATESECVHTVLYDIAADEKYRLDASEGLGAGYGEYIVHCEVGGRRHNPFTYLAQEAYIDSGLQPYDWYRDMVLEGARYHVFPEAYVRMLEGVTSTADPDSRRGQENRKRVEAMRVANSRKA